MNKDKQKKPRLFSETLNELRGGRYDAALTDALKEVVAAVITNGGKGTVSITLGVEAKGDDGALEINMKYSVKAPRPGLGQAIMFAGEDGELSLFDNNQPDMFDPSRSPSERPRVVSLGNRDDVPLADRIPATQR